MDALSEILSTIYYNLISNVNTYNSPSLSQPLQWQTLVNYITKSYLDQPQSSFSYLEQTSPTIQLKNLLTEQQEILWEGYEDSPNCGNVNCTRCFKEITASSLSTFCQMMKDLASESSTKFTVVKSILYYMKEYRAYSTISDTYDDLEENTTTIPAASTTVEIKQSDKTDSGTIEWNQSEPCDLNGEYDFTLNNWIVKTANNGKSYLEYDNGAEYILNSKTINGMNNLIQYSYNEGYITSPETGIDTESIYCSGN
jgi:hypothetical protein